MCPGFARMRRRSRMILFGLPFLLAFVSLAVGRYAWRRYPTIRRHCVALLLTAFGILFGLFGWVPLRATFATASSFDANGDAFEFLTEAVGIIWVAAIGNLTALLFLIGELLEARKHEPGKD